jgi:hypothetical protein
MTKKPFSIPDGLSSEEIVGIMLERKISICRSSTPPAAPSASNSSRTSTTRARSPRPS